MRPAKFFDNAVYLIVPKISNVIDMYIEKKFVNILPRINLSICYQEVLCNLHNKKREM